MKRIIAVLFMMCSLYAVDWSGKINWAMGYGVAQNIAESSNKLIMVDIGLTTCPPCKYMAEKVYSDKKVSDYVNKNFVSVFYLADQDSLPAMVQNYFTGSTPTILFIKPNGELYYRIIGARTPANFLNIIEEINSKYKGNK
jgi:uncharacterized protein YyaL (SSP411 family)